LGGAPLPGAVLRPQDRKTALGKSGQSGDAASAASSAIWQLRFELAGHRWQARLRVLRVARTLLLHPGWRAGLAEGVRPAENVQQFRRGGVDRAGWEQAGRGPGSGRRIV